MSTTVNTLPRPAQQPLQLRLPNLAASVETARLAVQAYLAECAGPCAQAAEALLSSRARYSLELALEEVLMNEAWHAFSAPGAGWVEVHVDLRDDAVHLLFSDDGRPFDPTLQAEPAAPGTLDDAQIGGLGLSLLRKRARRIAYDRRWGRNELTVEISRF